MNTPLHGPAPVRLDPATLLLPRWRALLRNLTDPTADTGLLHPHPRGDLLRPVDSVGLAEGEVLQFRQALRDFLDAATGDPA